MREPVVMQRQNERGRLAVVGKRIDNGEMCTLLAVCEIGGAWLLYPHGWGTFGVRLAGTAAETLARGILADGTE